MKKVIDLTDKTFNGIRVLERDYEKEVSIRKNNPKNANIFWKCICTCGKMFSPSGGNLKSGNTSSCGHEKKESMSKVGKSNSSQNQWTIENNIATGITNKGDTFIIDLEDLGKVEKYCWRISKYGYVVANTKDATNCIFWIHRVILNAKENEIVDHIDWNKKDNRKTNLRKCTKSENNINIKRKSNNTSGYTGVHKGNNGKWVATISYNNKKYYLGTFENLEDATKIRNKAEKLFHKDFNGEINRKDFLKFVKQSGDMEDAKNEQS